MSLVLSNAFKGLLLSSYVNIRFDLAVKSLQDLIDKPSIEIIYDNRSLHSVKEKPPEITKLLNRKSLNKTETVYVLSKDKEINKFRNGQAVIMCSSFNCRVFEALNPHLQMVYTEDPKFHSFACLRILKSYSHSKQIRKL